MKTRAYFKSLFSGQAFFFMASPAFLWNVLLLYIPLIIVIMLSFSKGFSNNYSFWVQGLTFEHYATLFNPIYGIILARSLLLAVFNAVFCILFAFPVAYYLAFHMDRFKNLMISFLILPFWINFLVQVYAWFFVLEKNGLLNSFLLKSGIITSPLHLLNTPFAVYLVMIYCYVPFAIMPIYSSLEKFDKRLLEASADLGATPWQTFVRVTLPLSAIGIRTGFFLVLVPSFGEFVVPTLLSGGKQLYVGSLISHYFLSARNFYVGSAFTCLSGLTLIALSILIYIFFKRLCGLGRVS